MKTVAEMIELGGNEWVSGDKHRIYFNNAMELAGYVVTRYNTGAMSSCRLDGEKISNAKAGELASLKVYYDVKAERLVISGHARMFDEFAERVKAALQ